MEVIKLMAIFMLPLSVILVTCVPALRVITCMIRTTCLCYFEFPPLNLSIIADLSSRDLMHGRNALHFANEERHVYALASEKGNYFNIWSLFYISLPINELVLKKKSDSWNLKL
ncbi:hypothetical protein QQP08_000900 [Theobroma cacao]|nr:hypothetical protein QQP08_000900 [Theobroma cacao]